ncbi:hypothetical protein BFP72_12230 [Reichenbachiella sp. 5M10]|uniref:aldose epimerase family protein n=1 Tax=Reichenbachiella sp. 5M10 TaxID=1889772 RepID=UPI000C1594F1|nr:hypothetical protein [Reichenbachiella sp. 5M10]PIB36107.1 hypothetical protein BFP72_12230 [Reichenbachiella sp. 5M10]
MYEVKKAPIGRFEAYRLIHRDTLEYVEILTGFGAGINDFVVKNQQGDLVSYVDGYRSEEEVMKTHHFKFKGSKLSPFPNRLTAGRYEFEGQSYQMYINEIDRNNNLHALLHNKPFEVIETIDGDTECKLVLGYDYLGTETGYPFAYRVMIEVVYGEDGVSFGTQVENTGYSTLPIGDGWHPYFQFDQGLSQVELQIGAAKRISSLVGNAVSDTHGFEVASSMGSCALDDCFAVVDGGAGPFVVSMYDTSNALELQLWQDKSYGYCQIYSPDTRHQLAVEPVSCPPNAFNTGEGLVVLSQGEKCHFMFGIKAQNR